MELEGNIIRARFKSRLNRFLAVVEIAGTLHQVHVPSSGRMKEMLFPDNHVLVREVKHPGRKTDFELIMACDDTTLVSIDSRLPNKLIFEALTDGKMEAFEQYHEVYPEVTLGDSRIDFLVTTGEHRCYIEVKSVTLVMDKRALFPDAPTRRGIKHLEELIRVRRSGAGSAVVFVIQRGDATSFSPNRKTNPEFARTLNEALNNGVGIIAYKCRVDEREVRLDGRVPVNL